MSLAPVALLPIIACVSRASDGIRSVHVRGSRFELHRAFRHATGEPPKRFTLRLRIERAAARLVTESTPIATIAADQGFASHEVFTRAFLRRFAMTPRAYRARGLAGNRTLHAAIVRRTGPCVGLYHLPSSSRSFAMSAVTVSRKSVPARHALVVARTIAPSQVAAAIAECLGPVFAHAQQCGIALASPPFTRYTRVGIGSLTIEAGFAVAAPAEGTGQIAAIELPACTAAFALHRGAYDTLTETHAAIERWIDEQKLERAGAPWEIYITDPGERPDPATWETEIYYPLTSRA
jgi:AraC family transcriptional regulator